MEIRKLKKEEPKVLTIGDVRPGQVFYHSSHGEPRLKLYERKYCYLSTGQLFSDIEFGADTPVTLINGYFQETE